MTRFACSAALQEETGALYDCFFITEVEAQLVAYLQHLGFQDGRCLRIFARECVQRAMRRTRRTLTSPTLYQQALKEVWKCLDGALSRHLGSGLYLNHHEIARARAALLLGQAPLSLEELFGQENVSPQMGMGNSLKDRLPQATPPEAPLAMPEQSFE
ncbi:hypothetical protein [Nitrosococcus wardiae]|uniref:Uncharacterized protein n=1 Tax=Nitrosococcus wardiae TaxID=1814290 RepID=A0A4P7C237_9GAMM|nr:hypothetical protein [Nitrosococcus wardiae]QBQ55710.1 hypothetical protein E3U44_15225 [Nitrosococcus wardiae]